MEPVQQIQNILQDNLQGKGTGIFSVCCSNREVLQAVLSAAKDKPYPVVIESTSNQVNQFGGYTGMTPTDYVQHVYTIADTVKYPKEKILLGGDHLGPNAWQHETSTIAMEKSCELIKEYIQAGYRKIHLDTSMACADDALQEGIGIGDTLVAQRAATLCKVAEETWHTLTDKGEAPVYIIGTEVPIPGGNTENENSIVPTSPEAAEQTFAITKQAFIDKGLEAAWSRVIAMVVQPGVEFSDDTIFFYDPQKSKKLSNTCASFRLVFEAHSTDYQSPLGLKHLVQHHYAILKVGPWLTYAYREALFNLAHIEQIMIEYQLLSKQPSNFRKNVIQFLSNNPKHWKKYYHGSPSHIQYKCIYSLSDRIRYYWDTKEMKEYVHTLLSHLGTKALPFSLVSQYFPNVINSLAPEKMNAQNIIQQHIISVLQHYEQAIA